jgi:hypothetical protein
MPNNNNDLNFELGPTAESYKKRQSMGKESWKSLSREVL